VTGDGSARLGSGAFRPVPSSLPLRTSVARLADEARACASPERSERAWSPTVEFRRLAAQAGVRRRFEPHQLRHAHAVELAREGVPLNVIQRQLGHAYLGTTSIYLQGIDTEEIIATVHARRAPMMSATAGLQL